MLLGGLDQADRDTATFSGLGASTNGGQIADSSRGTGSGCPGLGEVTGRVLAALERADNRFLKRRDIRIVRMPNQQDAKRCSGRHEQPISVAREYINRLTGTATGDCDRHGQAQGMPFACRSLNRWHGCR